MHPKGQFCPPEGCNDPKPGIWREISVGGCVFGLRESRSAAVQGPPVPSETSVLVDGTLIDLCGATLLWRSAEGKEILKTHLNNYFDVASVRASVSLFLSAAKRGALRKTE